MSKLNFIFGLLLTQSAFGQLLYLDQGIDEQSSIRSFYRSEGSQIIPAKWYFNLEVAGSRQDLQEVFENFGLVRNNPSVLESQLNPQRLPIGLTVSHHPTTAKLYDAGNWVGINCAGCHTSVIRIAGQDVIIRGGSALFNLQTFAQTIKDSVSGTLSDEEKFERLARRLKVDEQERLLLRHHLETYLQDFSRTTQRDQRYMARNGTETTFGPGRIDGIGTINNQTTCEMSAQLGDPVLTKLFNRPENCQSSQQMTNIPFIWGSPQQYWAQLDGSVHSSLGRNWGQSAGTFAKSWIEARPDGRPAFRTTTDLDGLVELEKYLKLVKAPTWNSLVKAKLARPFDQNLLARGEYLYEANCIQCHATNPNFTPPNMFGNSFNEVWIGTVGTSDILLRGNYERRSRVADFLIPLVRAKFGAESVDANGMTYAWIYRALIVGAQIREEFTERGLTPQQQAQVTNCLDPDVFQYQVGMKARSLEGAFLTAPFLHNGSVESLDELLMPAAERKREFYVGCRNYDLVSLGFNCDEHDTGAWRYDTTLEGNSNQGHEYGVDLSPVDRLALLEFIKGIQAPPTPVKNPNCN